MSETNLFYSEESDGMSKRAQLEEYFSQSLEVDLLLRLCPDDEDTIYQIVDLLVDTCATNRKLLYDSANFEAKKMIVNQLIRRVDVYRGYQINISFNFDLTPYIEGE